MEPDRPAIADDGKPLPSAWQHVTGEVVYLQILQAYQDEKALRLIDALAGEPEADAPLIVEG